MGKRMLEVGSVVTRKVVFVKEGVPLVVDRASSQ